MFTDDKKDSLLEDILSYLKKPKYISKKKDIKTGKKIWDIFQILALSLILSVIIGFIITVALSTVNYNQEHHELSDPKYDNPLTLLISAVFLAPILEETTFRLGLKFSALRLSFSLLFLTVFFIPTILTEIGLNFSTSLNLIYHLWVFVAIGLILPVILHEDNVEEYVKNKYHRYFPYIFYASAGLFALIHIFNYGNAIDIWFLTPLLVLPQLIGGLLFGFVRMKYSFIWAVILHISYNASLSISKILSTFLPESGKLSELTQDEMLIFSGLAMAALLLAIAVLIAFSLLLWEYFSKKFNSKINT